MTFASVALAVKIQHAKSLELFKKSQDFHCQASRIAHQYYAKISIGCAYINLNQYDAAEQILREVIFWGQEHNNYGVYKKGQELMAALYMRSGNVSEYLSLLGEGGHNDTLAGNYISAYYNAMYHNVEEAFDNLGSAWKKAKNAEDSIKVFACSYRINKRLGNYDAALQDYENLMGAQDSILRSAMQQPLINVQKDYFQSLAENRALKLKSNRFVIVFVVILAILVVVLIIAYYRYQLVRKQGRLDNYIELYHELEEIISAKDNEIDNIHAQVRKLFTNQYELLNSLCKTYYENPGSSIKGAIYLKVAKEIESFKSDYKIYNQLEQIVNEYNSDIMTKLKDGMPNLSLHEYQMFCFSCAGFSPKAISVFTGEPLCNLYVKKMRLKDKIMKRKPDCWQEIMSYLE